jgi:hypothetical protein
VELLRRKLLPRGRQAKSVITIRKSGDDTTGVLSFEPPG